MKEKILIIIAVITAIGIGFMAGQIVLIKTQKPSSIVQKVIDRSLDKYTIPNLASAWQNKGEIFNKSTISIIKQIKDYPTFTSNEFILNANLNLDGKTMKKVSGLINLPHLQAGTPDQKFPLIVMVRGYVQPEQYFIGNGTINGSLYFAKNGFITIAPDFPGYGDSDTEPANIFESRFQTYTTVMALLKSINQIPNWDGKNVFIWAHSNGGNIALTTLETTGVNYPTILWAPVSSSFPFSILYYSDESPDSGKFLRKDLSAFEDVYDTDLYSLPNYLSMIKAPIQLEQGTADDAVPVSWSDSLAKSLKEQGNEVNYNKIPGADHSMTPKWNDVIKGDLEFYVKNLQK